MGDQGGSQAAAHAALGLPGIADEAALLRLLLAQVPHLVYCYRLLPEPGFVYVSPACTAISGYTPEEHYADPSLVARVVHPEDRELLIGLASDDREGGPVEVRWIHRDGRIVWTEQRVRLLRDDAGVPVALLGVARDTTERRLREEQTSVHLAALETTASAVAVISREGVIEWVNAAFAELTGYTRAEAVGARTSLLRSGRQGRAFYRDLWQTTLAGRSWQGRLWNRRKDGSLYLEHQTVTPIRARDGRVVRFVAIKEAVSEGEGPGGDRDGLTGAWTRGRFLGELDRAVASGVDGSLALFDVDGLDAVNHVAGPAAGDRVLRRLGGILAAAMPPEAMIGRTEDDALAVLIPGRPTAEAGRMCERVILDLATAEPVAPGAALPAPSASAGVVGLRRDAATALRAAQAALVDAKARGRGQVAVSANHRREWAQQSRLGRVARDLEVALGAGEIALHLQPIMPIGGSRPQAFEVLMRVRAADGGAIPAAEAMEAAERFGLAVRVDRLVVERSLDLLETHPGLALFVNLSSTGLDDADLMSLIERRLAAAPGLAGRLTLEITESSIVRSRERAQGWMDRLHDLGCAFALDDFGEGFLSFALMRALPVDVVKLDGAAIRRLDREPESQAVVDAVTRVAHALGKRVVAECIETPAVERVAAELGIELGQGFRWAPPRPAAEVLAAWATS